MRDPTCPFCQPELESSVFYRDKGCLGITNIAPIVPGHCLVIPIAHWSRLLELPPDLYDNLLTAVRKVARILMAVYEAPAVDISIQDGIEAGQTVSHVHAHVIPRKAHDLPKPGSWYERLIDTRSRPRRSSEACAVEAAWIRQRRQLLGL